MFFFFRERVHEILEIHAFQIERFGGTDYGFGVEKTKVALYYA